MTTAFPHRLRLPLLLTAALLVWLYATGRWHPAAWQVPASYAIDSLEMLARLKLSADKGLGFLFDKTMPGLGAPWVADWSAYPMPDTPLFLVLGGISRSIGLMPAANLALLIAHLAAVAAFYVCSRALGHRAVFAAGGALLFGFSFYLFHRGLSHYSFTLAYVVPCQLLAVWLIGAGRGLLARARWRWFCLGAAAATGMGNPYFGFAFGQLLVFALAYQAATARRRRNLRLGFACLGVFAATLAALNYSALLALVGGQGELLARNYAGTELYGLRPIELFIPSYAHHWSVAARFGTYFATITSFKGELFYPYMGLAGVCGLAVMAATSLRLLRARRAGLRPAHAATFLWLTVFFMVGGLNSLLALAGVDLFRAGNRYSIYLLALALFALAGWSTRRGRRLGTGRALALTIPFVALCLWDQIPRAMPAADQATLAGKIAQDRQLARRLETTLPPGAAVFQLPAVPFLEQPPVLRMTDYELFRPWLYSNRMRFSYGLLAGDPALRWQRWVAPWPVEKLCPALERAGFAAIYVNKTAFPDAGAAWRSELTAAGKTLLFDEGDHLVFALQPADHPQLPDLTDPRLASPWGKVIEPDYLVQLYATAGWFALERDGAATWRWARREASVTFWCPGDRPRTIVVKFGASAQMPRTLAATFAGHAVWSVVAGQYPPQNVSLTLSMQPGANLLTFHYDGNPVRASSSDPRQLGFRIDDLRAEFVEQP